MVRFEAGPTKMFAALNKEKTLIYILAMCYEEQLDSIEAILESHEHPLTKYTRIMNQLFAAIHIRAYNIFMTVGNEDKVKLVETLGSEILDPHSRPESEGYLTGGSKIIFQDFTDEELKFLFGIYLYPSIPKEEHDLSYITEDTIRNIWFCIPQYVNGKENPVWIEIYTLINIHQGFEQLSPCDLGRVRELIFLTVLNYLSFKIRNGGDKTRTVFRGVGPNLVYIFITMDFDDDEVQVMSEEKMFRKEWIVDSDDHRSFSTLLNRQRYLG